MALKGTKTRVLVDEFDLSSSSSEVEVAITIAEVDGTVLDSTATEMQPMLPSCMVTYSGFLTGVNAGIEAGLRAALGTDGSTCTVIFGYDDDLPIAYTVPSTFGKDIEISTPATGLMALNGGIGSGSGYSRGIAGSVLRNATATGAGATRDNGSAGSSGGKAWIHVTAITGSASGATITVQSDSASGMGTASTEGTFTFSAVGSYEISLSGVVGRYLRDNVTSLGGATGIEYTVAMSVNNVN